VTDSTRLLFLEGSPAIAVHIDLSVSGFSFLGTCNPDRTSGSPSGLGRLFTRADTAFTLPARLAGGLRLDWEQFTFKTDFAWGFCVDLSYDWQTKPHERGQSPF